MSDLQTQLNEFAKRMGEQMAAVIKSLQERVEQQEKRLSEINDHVAKSLAESNELLQKSIEKMQEDADKQRESHAEIIVDALANHSDSVEKLIDQAHQGIKESQDAVIEVKEMVKSIEPPQPAKDGADGRDALDIEILPSINEEKSYPRGTFAIHNGGLFRSFQKTVGMVGWECVVNGLSSVDAAINGDDIELTIATSDGAVKSLRKPLPYPKYKGVFKRDQGYSVGDSVTWAGSLWVANENAEKGVEPGKSSEWTLAVKCGRDGKGLYAIARENGFKGTEKDLLAHIIKGEQPETIVRR